jgi:hypothetical protein
MKKNGTNSELQFEFDDERYERLEKEAKQNGITVEELVQLYLEKGIDELYTRFVRGDLTVIDELKGKMPN